MKPQLYLAFILSLTLFFASPPVMAKKAKCSKYKAKLENIQSKQRQPNSVKRSNKLKEQEIKAFKEWRACKQGKLNS